MVFCGKGIWISQQEKAKWDKRVVVDIQSNALVDEQVFLTWLKRQWKFVSGHGINAKDPHIIVMDVHRAQKTRTVSYITATAYNH